MINKSLTHHLYQNHRTWTFRFRWPEDVRNDVEEQHELHKSLKTIHLHEAMNKRDVLLAFCKKLVRTIRTGDRQEFENLRERLRSQELFSKDDILITPDKNQEYFDDTKLDNFKVFQRLIDESWADIFKNAEDQFKPKEKVGHLKALKQLEVLTKNALVYGNTAPFDIHLQEWLVIRRDQVTPKTLEDGRLSVAKFKEYFPTLETVKRRHVREWFDNQVSVYSPDRLKKFKQHLQSYWTFLKEGMDHMLVDEDAEPFKGIHIKENYNAEKQLNGWLPFPNLGEDIVRLLKGASTRGDQQLVNLIILDMYTGMRIEEACSLSIEHIDPDYIYVPKSKTTPEMRKIPIHSMLTEPLLLMVKESTDGYIISGLVSNNKYGIRSDPIGKRFGRLKSNLGFGPRYVFHSIKKTVTTIMEKADVRADVILDIVGHKNTTVTHVSSSMQNQKKAIEKLVYPLEYL